MGKAAGAEAGAGEDARGRLLVVATRLFAERGLAATSVRDLARAAGVNIAAVNYYFGSKDRLYLETFRHHCRQIREAQLQFEALAREAEAGDTPAAAEAAIRRFIEGIMRSLFSPDRPDDLPALLMREMSHPTAAIGIVTEEFLRPRLGTLVALIERARPDLAGRPEATLHALSIVGQCLYYRLARVVALRLLNRKKMTPELLAELTTHIADFSLRALDAGGDRPPARRKGRR